MFDNLGQCKWRYALVNGVKTDIANAQKGCKGICPLCGCGLIPRIGNIRNWHWWHQKGRNCDAWYEVKGEWHRWWQGHFDYTQQEYPMAKIIEGDTGKHIADVCTDDGCVIEFQYSSLPLPEIHARETFYGDMVWVVCGTRLKKDRKYGEALLRRNDFLSSDDGLQYLVLKDLKGLNKFWCDSDKLVFFDFYGEFDIPSDGTDLMCLIPGKVEESRLVVRVGQAEFLSGCRCGDMRSFINRFLKCKQSYVRHLENIGYLDKSVTYALTIAPVDGWLIAHGHLKMTQVNLKGVDNIAVKGRCAIRFSSYLTSQSYWWSKKILKSMGIADSILKAIPSELDLKSHLNEFIGIASYVRHGQSEMVSLELDDFKWLKHRFKYLHERQTMWRLDDDLRQRIEQQIGE